MTRVPATRNSPQITTRTHSSRLKREGSAHHPTLYSAPGYGLNGERIEMIVEKTQAPTRLFYGRQTAAELIDVSPRTIDDAIRCGAIDARRVGRRVLVSHAELVRFV